MSDKMQAEITAAIDAHLPTQVGKALQKRLEQAEADVKDLSATKAKLASTEAALADEKKEVDRLREKIDQHEALDIREAAIAERERNAEIIELKIKLEAANEAKDFTKNVALGLVRNIEYRRNRYGLVPVQTEYTDSYGHTQKSAHTVHMDVNENDLAT